MLHEPCRVFSQIFFYMFPGMGWQVFITEPQDVQTMLANEGKHPVEPGFDFFVNYRHYK